MLKFYKYINEDFKFLDFQSISTKLKLPESIIIPEEKNIVDKAIFDDLKEWENPTLAKTTSELIINHHQISLRLLQPFIVFLMFFNYATENDDYNDNYDAIFKFSTKFLSILKVKKNIISLFSVKIHFYFSTYYVMYLIMLPCSKHHLSAYFFKRAVEIITIPNFHDSLLKQTIYHH